MMKNIKITNLLANCTSCQIQVEYCTGIKILKKGVY